MQLLKWIIGENAGRDAELAEVPDITPYTGLNEADALDRIISAASTVNREQLRSVAAPQKTFFCDEEKKRWHLAYYFRNVPAAPAGFFDGLKSHSGHRSLAARNPELDYLVDAHDGSILLYWSSTPTSIPVACRGADERGVNRQFYGQLGPTGA